LRFLADTTTTTTDGTEVSGAAAVGTTTLDCIKANATASCPTAEEAK